jgi:hypothetical protein
MNIADFRRHAITLVSLIIVFVVFSSSVFYNSIEGPFVVACFILLVLFNKDILSYAKDVKMMFFIHVLFACSVLTTGISFYTRQQVSLTGAISDASSIILTSFLGFIVYVAFRNQTIVRYRMIIVSLFAIGLFAYCVSYPHARVHDFDHRYIIGLGLLFTIISLTILVTYHPTSWPGVAPLVGLNTINLYLLFIAIESRAMTLALGSAWLIAVVVTLHKKSHKIALFFIPVAFCFTIQFFDSYGSETFKRYVSLYSLALETSRSNFTNSSDQITKKRATAESATDPSEPATTLEVAPKVLQKSNTSSAVMPSDQTKQIDVLVDRVASATDGSIGVRFHMLIIGFSAVRNALVFGNGNLFEKQLIDEKIGTHHPHLHNQYLSFLTAGGILHLVLGLAFICAPLINNTCSSSKATIIRTIPILSFVLVTFCFTSFLQIKGWQNLYIIYSFALASYLPSIKIAE